MENLEIFFSGNDELTEFEVQQKEYRNDIIVKVGKNLFQPLVITPSRLLSDFNYSISAVSYTHLTLPTTSRV